LALPSLGDVVFVVVLLIPGFIALSIFKWLAIYERKLIENAYERLKEAKADLIVANDVARKGVGFGVETNEIFIVDKKRGVVHVPLTTKREAAENLLDVIAKRIRSK